mgnify:CR=1 FL=1
MDDFDEKMVSNETKNIETENIGEITEIFSEITDDFEPNNEGMNENINSIDKNLEFCTVNDNEKIQNSFGVDKNNEQDQPENDEKYYSLYIPSDLLLINNKKLFIFLLHKYLNSDYSQ